MEEMRRQFDKWWDEKLSGAFNSCPKEHHDSAYHAAWLAYQEAWKQSRAALVVDIASHTEFEIEHMISPEKEGYSIGWIDGRNYSVKQICAAGITVKGEGDLISTPDHVLDKK